MRGLTKKTGAFAACAAILLSIGPGGPMRPANAAATLALASMCNDGTAAPATWDHVIVIMEENRAYSSVIGPKGSAAYNAAPYINGTLAAQCGLATNYHNVDHPSLPNYLALTSGAYQGAAANSDCNPSGCMQGQPSIFTQLPAAGKTWGVYAEGMPSPCYTTNNTATGYAVRHTGAPYYSTLGATACKAHDVALGTYQSGAFETALKNSTLPSYSLVFTNLSNDMHDGTTTQGDTWLKNMIPTIVGSPTYQAGKTAIFVIWDEGEGSDFTKPETCYDATHSNSSNYPSCWAAALVISPSTRAGARSSQSFNHFSMLRTQESMLGLTTYLGSASTAASMRGTAVGLGL